MPEPMFLPAVATEVCQGDVVDGIIIPDGLDSPSLGSARVVLLTNDCDIDKKKSHPVMHVVRVVSFDELDPNDSKAQGFAGDVRKDRVAAAMMLGDAPSLPPSFVDFRHVHRVSREPLMEAANKGQRIASMSEDGRKALFLRLYTYFRRKQQPRGEPIKFVEPGE